MISTSSCYCPKTIFVLIPWLRKRIRYSRSSHRALPATPRPVDDVTADAPPSSPAAARRFSIGS